MAAQAASHYDWAVEARNKARAAKGELQLLIGSKSWLRGIGLSTTTRGKPVLKVNVAALTPQVRAEIPRKVMGVQVRVAEIRGIKALARE